MDSAELHAYLNPVSPECEAISKTNSENFASNIRIHGRNFPDLKGIQLVIIAIGTQAESIRLQLYQLMWRFDALKVADLGNIVDTKNEAERRFVLEEIHQTLFEKNICTLVLGDQSSDQLAIYNAMCKYEKIIEMVQINPLPQLNETSELRQIITQKPNHLFNIEFLATQAYLIPNSIDTYIEKLYLGKFPLGQLRKNISHTEPLFRSAHMVQLDIASIKASELPHTPNLLPNGLFNHETAILSRYAGISNNCRSMYISNTQLAAQGADGAQQVAQLLWYFIEGYGARFNDEPVANHADFIVYRNQLISSKHELVFYKSRKSNRWWMEIPHPYQKQSFFVACNYIDYEQVLQDEMPDRWWKAFQRLM